MKSYKFKFSTTIWVLLAFVFILSVAGAVWNIFSIIEYVNVNNLKVITGAITCLLCLALTVISLSVILYGKYVIKNGELISYMGVIRSKYPLKTVKEITLFKKSNKLVMYFEDGKYTVIVISPELYESFVLSVREQNKSIIYNEKIEGEDTPE